MRSIKDIILPSQVNVLFNLLQSSKRIHFVNGTTAGLDYQYFPASARLLRVNNVFSITELTNKITFDRTQSMKIALNKEFHLQQAFREIRSVIANI